MKKVYAKPEIVFESFSMSTNIAGGCDTIINNHSYGNCAYVLRTGEMVFVAEYPDVCKTVEADGDWNGICYHVPVDTQNLFNS